jgi:glycosyltransferase involved in cell wall biosynthesis
VSESRPPQRRVLHIIPDLGMGGAEHVLMYLATLADSADFQCHVLSLAGATGSEIEKKLLEAGIEVTFLEKHRGFDVRMFWQIDRVLARLRPDVVHTHRHVLRYALPSLQCRGIHTIHTLHNMAERESDGVGKFVQALAFHAGVRPVAISPRVAESAERLYGLKRVACLPNAIPIEKYENNPVNGLAWRREHGVETNEILITVLGRLSEQKNPALAIRAFAGCGSTVTGRAHLAFAGDGPLLPSLRGLADECRVEGRIKFLGVLKDVVPLLSASDVVVMCSDWEGTPLVVMEAMAEGVPVIATDVGAVPILIEHGTTGMITPVRNCGALTYALTLLCTNRHLRLRMGAAAHSVATCSFGISPMVRAYEDLYRFVSDPPASTQAANAASMQSA